MVNIIKTEWLKIKNYPAFWWVMGITTLTYPGVNYLFLNVYRTIIEKQGQTGEIAKALLGNPFGFPEAWRSVAYFSSIFVFIPAIVVIMLITNEYTYKTNRQNIIDGWSREDFMKGKLIDVLILAVIVTTLYTIVSFVLGITNTDDPTASKWKLVYYVGLFALQSFAQLSIAFLVGLIVRKSFIALAIFAFYYIILEPVAVKLLEIKLKTTIGKFFPLEVSHRLLPKPSFLSRFDEKAYQASLDAVNPHILYTFIMIIITWTICFLLMQKRDL